LTALEIFDPKHWARTQQQSNKRIMLKFCNDQLSAFCVRLTGIQKYANPCMVSEMYVFTSQM